jgi:hypothetical protein
MIHIMELKLEGAVLCMRYNGRDLISLFRANEDLYTSSKNRCAHNDYCPVNSKWVRC